jgi:hypothetical protein
MRLKQRSSMALSAVIVIALFCTNALTNDGTPPEIFELIQDEQDIVVTLLIVEEGEPGISDEYDLVAHSSQSKEKLLNGKRFHPSNAMESTERCRRGFDRSEACASLPDKCPEPDGESGVECRGTPDPCKDCDGDGIPECPVWGSGLGFDSWCETVHYFEVINHCVPAGTASYSFSARDWSFRDSASIEVTGSGKKCTVPGEGDCSVTKIGAGNPGGPLALLMIGMGMAVFLFARRRSGQR